MRNIIFLLIFGIFAFLIGNNVLSLTDPDEVFYTGTASEMAAHGTWVTPYLFNQPQFEKPILTYDLIRVGLLIFGKNSFGARFFPALFALIGGLAVYFLGRLFFRRGDQSVTGALMLMSSGLFIGLARTVFTDMIFTVFILLALACFYWAYEKPARKDIGLVLFNVFAALAVLTKGPLGYVIPLAVVVVFLFLRRRIKFLACGAFCFGTLLFLLLAVPWYALMFYKYDGAFIKEFFYNDHWRRLIEAEHLKNDRWYFYPLSMLGCMFPWVIFTAAGMFNAGKSFFKGKADPVQQFLLVWIVVVFVVFQVAHSKLVSYIFPLFPAMALLSAIYWVKVSEKNRNKFIAMLWGTWGLCALILVVLLAGPLKFSTYVSFSPRFILVMAVEAVFLLAMAIFIRRQQFQRVLLCFSGQLPLIFMGALLMWQNIEPFASTHYAAQYLATQPLNEGKILCSKFLARSTRYYLDKDVAIFNMGGKNYFSPHPIEMIDTPQALDSFLKRQKVTYGIFECHDLEDIKTGASKLGMKTELLKTIGDKCVFVVE
ncbi:MAG: glycosyltransferase family 39 protein [Candidatus Omnitrophota bacterium]